MLPSNNLRQVRLVCTQQSMTSEQDFGPKNLKSWSNYIIHPIVWGNFKLNPKWKKKIIETINLLHCFNLFPQLVTIN